MLNAAQIASSAALHNKDAEMCVIGGIAKRLESGKRNAIYAIGEDDFFFPNHRMIYCAMRSLCDEKKPVDLVTVDEEITRLYPKAGNDVTNDLIQALAQMVGYVNLEQYIEIVQEAAMRRKLLAVADEIAQTVTDKSMDVSAITDTARASLRSMVKSKNNWITIGEVLIATYGYLEKRVNGEIVGIKSGVADVDRATGGFFPGEMAVIGARPSVGKSAFALQIAIDAASKGHKVCFISCEMIAEQFGQRLLSNSTKIDGMKLRNAEIEDKDWFEIAEAMGYLDGLPISFIFGSKAIETIRDEIQNKIDLGECDMLVVDYLQLLKTKRRFEMEHERVAHVSRTLKEISAEFEIPVVALAQVKRQNNNGRARCPTMDELRSSGDIEQDADTIIFLHRPDDEYDPTIDDRDKSYFNMLQEHGKQYIVFSVAKQRQGQIGIVGAAFDPAHMRYLSMERVRSESK